MNKATWKDTFDHMFGSGATSYSWWGELIFDGMQDNGYDPTDNWSVTLICDDREKEGVVTKTVNHEVVMEAAREVLRMYLSKEPEGRPQVPHTVVRECAMLLFDADYVDFDADSADCLLQIMVLGSIVFG